VNSIALESIYLTEEKRGDEKDRVSLCFYRKLKKFRKAKLAKENMQFHKTSTIWSKNILITILCPPSGKIH